MSKTRGFKGSAVGTWAVLGLVLAPIALMIWSTLEGDVASRWEALQGKTFDRLVNSIILAAGATVVSLAIAIPLALCLHRASFVGRRAVGVLYIAPLLVPPHINCISWLRIFGDKGSVTKWFADNWDIAFDVRTGYFMQSGTETLFPGAIWITAASFWPLAALVISAGLAQLDPRYEEAALTRRSRGVVLRRVTLPLLAPHIAAGAFFVFIFSIACYPIPSLLDTPTIMQEIFHYANDVDASTGAVVSLPLVVITLAALIAVTAMGGRRIWGGTTGARAATAALRPKSWRAGIVGWGICITTFGWPFYALMRQAGAFETYQAVWANVRPEIYNSLILAFSSAAILTASAVAIASYSQIKGGKKGFLIETLALLPFAFPALVVGVATNIFWSRFSSVDWIDRYIYQGAGIAIAINLMIFLPFAVRAVKTSFSRLGQETTEAARLSGRGPTAVFGKIVLPLVKPGVAAAFVLAFILTMGELAAGLIVRPPDWSTVQTRIFNMIHFSRDDEVAAICVMVALMTLIPAAAYSLLFNRKVEVL